MTTQDPHAWQDGLQVISVPDEQILSQHSFATSAEHLSRTAPGRTKHLRSEIQWLQDGLPRNIFVRYGESRMDVMKIVISGPVGSPYEHGLFEFDLLCPAEYPREPPKMFFRTTGGGSVYFNPNLYHNGYVCLSLINTWNGDQWQPGTSTLLQVLVSIQAMVFCEEPWCNEPGREGLQGTEASFHFNHSLYKNVVKYGMLEWIERKKTPPPPPKSNRWSDIPPGIPGTPPASSTQKKASDATTSTKDIDIFSEVALKYFDANRADIIATVKRWIKEVDEAKVLAEKKFAEEMKNMPPPPPFPPGFDPNTPPPPPPSSFLAPPMNTQSTTSTEVGAMEHFLTGKSKKAASLPPAPLAASGAAKKNPFPPPSTSKSTSKVNGTEYQPWFGQPPSPSSSKSDTPPPPPKSYAYDPLTSSKDKKYFKKPPGPPPGEQLLSGLHDKPAWLQAQKQQWKDEPKAHGKNTGSSLIQAASSHISDDTEYWLPPFTGSWGHTTPFFEPPEPATKPPPPKARYFTRSVASRHGKKIDFVPDDAILLQHLKAALVDLGWVDIPRRRTDLFA